MKHTTNVKIYMFIKKLFGSSLARMYNFTPISSPAPDSPFLLIANHVTNYDPILIGIAMDSHMYFVAGEHLYRGNPIMRLATKLFSPISRIKGKSGASTTIQIIKTLKDGSNVCLFAEGNTTFNGITEPISNATGKLARISGATLVTYRIEGAYLASPRWGRGLRKGPVSGSVVGIYPPEQLKEMTPEEITDRINRDIYEDAFDRQTTDKRQYRGKYLAERLELALYICPKCEQIGTLKSAYNTFGCSCGFSAHLNENGFFEGEELPFETIKEWDAWQDSKMTELAEKLSDDKPLFFDKGFILRKVFQTHKYITESKGALSMSAKELICGTKRFPINEISGMAIHGPASLVFTVGSDYYEIKPSNLSCTRKYFTLYNKLKEIHNRKRQSLKG